MLFKKRRTRTVTKYEPGKVVEISRYNPITKKGVYKQKEIAYRVDGEPREKFVEKQVVKRDKDWNWKSEKSKSSLYIGGKKQKSETSFNTYKPKNKKQKS
jgi:hypothetical protein